VVDFLTAAERSKRMASIRSRDTAPELLLRRALHALGYRYVLNDRRLPGRPDIVLPKYKTVIFVHGCFWHHHKGCKIASTPKTNTEFWQKKFARNVDRDARAVAELTELRWRVLIVWECALSSAQRAICVANDIKGAISDFGYSSGGACEATA
jgi:DNA mismatch endonuclease (patch repair protein)